MLDKTFKQLRIVFASALAFSIVTFIIDVLYTMKYVQPVENPVLERWAILITLIGIVGILRFLHPKLKADERKNKSIEKNKFSSKFQLRLFSLVAIYIFNLACLHFTGVKNFIFLGFITIFALLLCLPNKQNIEKETFGDSE